MKKRIIAFLLCMCLSIPLLPVRAEAADDPDAAYYLGWLWPVQNSIKLNQGYHSGHNAIDIGPSSARASDPILAAKAGTVIFVYQGCTRWSCQNNSHSSCNPYASKYNNGKIEKTSGHALDSNGICNYGYGNGVVIDHGDGSFSSYAHMQGNIQVQAGQHVNQGDTLGYMGSYGNSGGEHLHFAILKGCNTKGWYRQGTAIKNGPIGNEYKCTGTFDPSADKINYSRSYHNHSFSASTHICSCGEWDRNSVTETTYSASKIMTAKNSSSAKSTVPARTGPYMNCKSINISNGTDVSVIGEVKNAENNTWYTVKIDGAVYYIYGEHLKNKVVEPVSTLNLNCNLQSSNMKLGSANTIVGTLSSNYAMTVSVMLDGNLMANYRCSEGSYTIKTSEINTCISFSSLSKGVHTIKIDVYDMKGASRSATLNLTVTSPVDTPVVRSVENIAGGKRISLNCATSGASVYYTTDGTAPSGNGNLYTGPFTIQNTSAIRAIAILNSELSAPLYYNVEVSKASDPVISTRAVPAGTQVSISAQADAKIYYVIDGAKRQYTGQFTVDRDTSVTAYAEKLGCTVSDSVSENVKVSAPAAPVLTSPVNGLKTAQNRAVSVSWKQLEDAYSYTLYIYKDGELLETRENLTECFLGYITEDTGEYSFEVIAKNAIGTSEKSAARSVTSMAPLTVTFCDDDGTVLLTQTVDYGGTASAPANPSKKGHTFLYWDSSRTNIIEDTTITAVYKKNTYRVEFRDANGIKIGNTQMVEYLDSAEEPDISSISLPTGYAFLGWSYVTESADSLCDMTKVDSNMTLTMVTGWENDDLPVIAEIISAVRRDGNATGNYAVKVKLTNYDKAYTTALLRVSIMTQEGKMLRTESRTVSLEADGTAIYDFTLRYSGTSTVAEAYVLGFDTEGENLTSTALSQKASAAITNENIYGDWSEWSFTAPEEEHDEVETKTVYRYSTRTTASSAQSSLSGWTKTGQTTKYGEWVNQGWTTSKPVENDTRRIVATRTVTDSNAYTKYNYYHYRVYVGSKTYFTYGTGYWSKQGYTCYYYETSSTTPFTYYKTYDSNYPAYTDPSGTVWWSNGTTTVPAVTHTEWRYETRSSYPWYSYEKWSDITECPWQDTPVAGSANTRVETAVMYRYHDLVEIAGDEDNSGNEYRITNDPIADLGEDPNAQLVGNVLPEKESINLAGRLATVMIYKGKNTDPNESQIQYIGQITIDDGNLFDFSFRTKDIPSAQTGDYTVSLGIEGTSGLVNIGVIKAPKPAYQVIYYDYAGSIISEQTVTEGNGAVPPTAPEHEGYRFITWSDTATNVYCNMEISAVEIPETYALVFIDWKNESAQAYALPYGSSISAYAPASPEAEGCTFTGWNILDGEGTLTELAEEAQLTENTILIAGYEVDSFTVRFYEDESNSNLLSEQQIAYGESAVLPEIPNIAGKQFLSWTTDNEWWCVKEDMNVYAITEYLLSTSQPIPEMNTPGYGIEDVLTLSAEDDAEIYYTLDGEDPVPGLNAQEYTDPIELDSSKKIKAIAVKPGKNTSDVIEINFEYYAGDEIQRDYDWITVGNYTAAVKPDDNVSVSVNIQNNPGLNGFLFHVECDPAVFYPDFEEGSGIVCSTGDLTSDGYCMASQCEDGWKILWFSSETAEGDGTLFTLPLHVDSDAEMGSYVIKLSYSSANMLDSDFVETECDCSGAIGGAILRGDCNGDGELTLADVILILRHVVSLESLSNLNAMLAADVNNDGTITVADALKLARYIAGLETVL